MRYSSQLRAAAGDYWERVTHHKFTRELASGRIDRAVLTRYLLQDYECLDALVVLLAAIVSRARCFEDRVVGCQFLANLTGPENTYFRRCFDKLNVPAAQHAVAPVTKQFCTLLKTVAAKGEFSEMLSVMIACEWTYLSWAQLVQSDTNRDDFVTYEWVDLHNNDEFVKVVEYLRTLLDQEEKRMNQVEKDTCLLRFMETLRLEEEFFNAAYTGDSK